MKKFISFALMALFTTSVWADTTVSATQFATSQNGTTYTVTAKSGYGDLTGVTITTVGSGGGQSSGRLKVPVGTFNFSVASGKVIKSITINWRDATNNYPASNSELTANVGSVSTSDKESTWEGASQSVSLTNASANTFQVVGLSITYGAACEGTIPGDIEKGDLVDGVLTLNATGTPADDNVWYWQTSATGEDKTNSGSSFNVTAAGTFYIRSLYDNDCWTDAKSITITSDDFKTPPTVTFSDGAYTVNAPALDLSTLFTSNSDGDVTYTVKTDGGTDASIDGSNFTATTAGTAVVQAEQATTATYAPITKTANIVVTYPATGKATIIYNVAVGTSNTELGTDGTSVNCTSISNMSNFTAAGDLIVSGRGAGKDGLSTKLQTLSSKDLSKYIYVTFDVAANYTFKLDSVITNIVAVSNAKTIEVVMSDTNGTKDSLNYSQGKNSTAAAHTFDFTSTAKVYAGTVTMKLYAYGNTDDYRLGQPLKIMGIVAVKTPPTALENTSNETKAVKRIENGMLVIEKNGVRYNAQGQVIR